MAAPTSTMWPIELHTRAKHTILEAYLGAWFPILAARHDRLVYCDGLAGPERYSGGKEGSPVIALRVARDHLARLQSELVFVFVEKARDRAYWLERQEIPALNLPNNFRPLVIRDEFEPALRQTLDSLDHAGPQIAPTFAFIDPFGITGLPFTLIRRLLSRPRCEVLITFMGETIRRSATELPDRIDGLVGKAGASRIIATSPDRGVAARRLYEESLRSAAHFVRFFQMRDRNDVPIYDLFFASNNALGHEKMKEAMWRVDESGAYSFADGANPAQMTFVSERPGFDLAPLLWKEYSGRKVYAEDVLQFAVDRTPYLRKHAREALSLLESGPLSNDYPITVSSVKRDGRRRRRGGFPTGTSVSFGQGLEQ